MDRQVIGKILPMCLDRMAIKNFYNLHRRFKENKAYKLRYLIDCSYNVIKHERIVKHDRYYICLLYTSPIPLDTR